MHVHLYITCNKKILFVKKYLSLLWVFTDFSILLVAFWTQTTAITRQLIRTARTLEADCWQVCREAWVRGQRKMSQVLDAFGLQDFTMLRPVLAWCAFWNLRTVQFFNFRHFFSCRGKPQIAETADTVSAVTGVRLYMCYCLIKFELQFCDRRDSQFILSGSNLHACRLYRFILYSYILFLLLFVAKYFFMVESQFCTRLDLSIMGLNPA